MKKFNPQLYYEMRRKIRVDKKKKIRSIEALHRSSSPNGLRMWVIGTRSGLDYTDWRADRSVPDERLSLADGYALRTLR